MKSKLGRFLLVWAGASCLWAWAGAADLSAQTAGRPGSKPEALQPPGVASFVGSKSCQECHVAEYENFKAYSKKARSFQSVQKMMHGLNEAELKKCYECHTTGYGKKGGFVSLEQTPLLAEVGCETCHGPGGLHVASQSAKDIRRKLSSRDCDACHNSERVVSFNYKPLIFGGAH